MKTLYMLVTVFFVLSSSQAADWIKTEKLNDTAYFFVSSPPKIERYDLQNRQWLSPITLPPARGALTTGKVDADGFYVAFDKSTYRYNLNGSNEQFIFLPTTLCKACTRMATCF
jgi:opacity protein-like surface antigen